MTTAGNRKSQKRKQSRSTGASGQRAKRKPRAVAAALLKASGDATRKQDLRKISTPKSPLQRHNSGGTALSPALDVVGLLNRRTKAVLELPTRIARCHSPLEVWSEQVQFMQEGFADYTHLVMTNILYGLQRTTRP